MDSPSKQLRLVARESYALNFDKPDFPSKLSCVVEGKFQPSTYRTWIPPPKYHTWLRESLDP